MNRKRDRDIDGLKKAMGEVFGDFPSVEVRKNMHGIGELRPIIRVKKSFIENATPEEILALLVHEYTHMILGSSEHGELFDRTAKVLQDLVKEKIFIEKGDNGKLYARVR